MSAARVWIHTHDPDECEDVCALWIKLADGLFVYVLANGKHGFNTGNWVEKGLDDDPENWVRL